MKKLLPEKLKSKFKNIQLKKKFYIICYSEFKKLQTIAVCN